MTTWVASGMLGQPASVTTGHRVVTVVPSTPLGTWAGCGGAGVEPVGSGAASVGGGRVDAHVGSAVGVSVLAIAVGALPEPTQPVRTSAVLRETTSPWTT